MLTSQDVMSTLHAPITCAVVYDQTLAVASEGDIVHQWRSPQVGEGNPIANNNYGSHSAVGWNAGNIG